MSHREYSVYWTWKCTLKNVFFVNPPVTYSKFQFAFHKVLLKKMANIGVHCIKKKQKENKTITIIINGSEEVFIYQMNITGKEI